MGGNAANGNAFNSSGVDDGNMYMSPEMMALLDGGSLDMMSSLFSPSFGSMPMPDQDSSGVVNGNGNGRDRVD